MIQILSDFVKSRKVRRSWAVVESKLEQGLVVVVITQLQIESENFQVKGLSRLVHNMLEL
jgi:hypothetical protein